MMLHNKGSNNAAGLHYKYFHSLTGTQRTSYVKIHLLLKKKKAVMFCAIHSPLEEYDCVNWFY